MDREPLGMTKAPVIGSSHNLYRLIRCSDRRKSSVNEVVKQSECEIHRQFSGLVSVACKLLVAVSLFGFLKGRKRCMREYETGCLPDRYCTDQLLNLGQILDHGIRKSTRHYHRWSKSGVRLSQLCSSLILPLN